VFDDWSLGYPYLRTLSRNSDAANDAQFDLIIQNWTRGISTKFTLEYIGDAGHSRLRRLGVDVCVILLGELHERYVVAMDTPFFDLNDTCTFVDALPEHIVIEWTGFTFLWRAIVWSFVWLRRVRSRVMHRMYMPGGSGAIAAAAEFAKVAGAITFVTPLYEQYHAPS
jgi:hypothetical protein